MSQSTHNREQQWDITCDVLTSLAETHVSWAGARSAARWARWMQAIRAPAFSIAYHDFRGRVICLRRTVGEVMAEILFDDMHLAPPSSPHYTLRDLSTGESIA